MSLLGRPPYNLAEHQNVTLITNLQAAATLRFAKGGP